MKRNSARAKVSQATTGDEAARRHDWQWQTMLFTGFAVAANRAAPHMQIPRLWSYLRKDQTTCRSNRGTIVANMQRFPTV